MSLKRPKSKKIKKNNFKQVGNLGTVEAFNKITVEEDSPDSSIYSKSTSSQKDFESFEKK